MHSMAVLSIMFYAAPYCYSPSPPPPQPPRAMKEENVPVWLRPYGIVATSPDSGVIEAVPDTVGVVYGMVVL